MLRVNVTLPVFDLEPHLRDAIARLHTYLEIRFSFLDEIAMSMMVLAMVLVRPPIKWCITTLTCGLCGSVKKRGNVEACVESEHGRKPYLQD